MRILGAIVLAQSLFVTAEWRPSAVPMPNWLFVTRISGAKPVEQLSQEFHGSSLVAPSLDEKVQDLALVVNGSP